MNSSKPIRVQRKRTRGYRMPENTKCVSRPSIYGNPFRAERWGLDLCLKLYQQEMEASWNPTLIAALSETDALEVYKLHCEFRKRFGGAFPIDQARYDLRGFNLACFCPIGKPCHVDWLIEKVNS